MKHAWLYFDLATPRCKERFFIFFILGGGGWGGAELTQGIFSLQWVKHAWLYSYLDTPNGKKRTFGRGGGGGGRGVAVSTKKKFLAVDEACMAIF